MIDIHSHILPRFDDGAQSVKEAVEMARIAAADGTKVLFATPHIASEIDLNLAGEIAQKAASLQSDIDRESIDIRIIPAAEVYPVEGILAAVDSGAPLALGPGSKHILLDCSLSALPVEFEQIFLGLQSRGYTAILAHPERVRAIQKDPRQLESFVQRGLLLQVNAASITGDSGSAIGNAAFTLLRQNWVQLVASDAHSTYSRKPGLSAAMKILAEEIGPESALELVEGNGRRILNHEPIPTNPSPWNPESHGRRFGLFGER